MLSSLLLLVPSVLLVAPAAAAPQAIKLAPNGQVEVECMAVTETVTVYEDDIPAAPTVAVNSEKALSQLSTSTLTFTTKATTTTTVFIGATGSRIAQPAVPSVPVASVKPNVVASSGAQQPSSAPASIPPAVSPENTPRIEANQSAPAPKPGTYRNALYFTNWGIYGANFQPQQIPANQVSHILYSFADIGSDGEVKSSDSYADLQKHYPTDSWNDQGNNVYGCVKQLYLLKKKNRGMKVLLSIGGWTYSPKFPPVAATEAGRQKFASSAVKLVKDWGLDGIDIDWEYPANQAEAQNFVLLLQACRQALDAYAQQYAPGYHFIITIASPAGPSHIKDMDLEGMDPWVDAWHLMAYDYAGSWDSTSGHQANIYANGENPSATKFNTESAVRDYLVRGIPAHKISLGLPLYGRSFESTTGLGQPYNGIGQGSIQSGVWLFKDLPRNGAQEKYDDVAKASYSFDPSTNELITYDTVSSAIQKAQYLVKKGLGGAVFWEASGDKTGANSLVSTLATQMGTLDPTPNLLSYPASQYDNLRAGMTGL